MARTTRYWLVNSGTTEAPWSGDLVARYRAWNEVNGDVQGFSRRPASMRVGDVLIHRAVGSDRNRLIAVGKVVGPPRDINAKRWTWRIPRQLTHVCPSLRVAPMAEEFDIVAFQMRTYKELDASAGERAAARIAELGRPFSQT